MALDPENYTGEALDWFDAKRAELCTSARAEVGSQTKGHPTVRGYWVDVAPYGERSGGRGFGPYAEEDITYAAKHEEWCGVFVLSRLHAVGLALDVNWQVGSGFVLRAKLPKTSTPLPGDLCIKPLPFWHHSLVIGLSDGTLSTVDGNQPDVRFRTRPLPKGLDFYSIQPFLDAALAAL